MSHLESKLSSIVKDTANLLESLFQLKVSGLSDRFLNFKMAVLISVHGKVAPASSQESEQR